MLSLLVNKKKTRFIFFYFYLLHGIRSHLQTIEEVLKQTYFFSNWIMIDSASIERLRATRLEIKQDRRYKLIILLREINSNVRFFCGKCDKKEKYKISYRIIKI